jgi:hypothetical protein
MIVVVLVGAGAWFLSNDRPSKTGEPRVIRAEGLYSWNIHDPRRVAGRKPNLFFGKVVSGPEVLAGTPEDPRPLSIFGVAVSENLQGELPAEVTVTQKGGTDPNTGRTIIMDGDELLKTGTTYFFATAPETLPDGRSVHRVTPSAGDVPVETDAERDELREIYEDAMRAAITEDDDEAAATP